MGARKEDYATSARLYREAADLGNTDAVAALGQHYVQGLGVARDLKEAARVSSASPPTRGAPPARPSCEALRNWESGLRNAACAATGETWSGAGCYSPAGRPYDPHSGRCTGGGYPC